MVESKGEPVTIQCLETKTDEQPGDFKEVMSFYSHHVALAAK
jgi:hypothetical protein